MIPGRGRIRRGGATALAAFLACSLFASCIATGASAQTGANSSLPVETVAINGHIFNLEVAATPAQREHGLMFRKDDDIPFDGGMIFVFPDDAVRRFWMCNTPAPLDIAFVDRNGRVTAMHTMYPEPEQQPQETDEAYRERLPLYSSRKPCRYAIEFKAGTFGLLDLKVGDRIALDAERLRKRLRSPEADGKNAP
jgi:uncharacterized membrane protein (UPF0127 family)